MKSKPIKPVHPPQVGHSYVFIREGHKWHASEVAVIAAIGEHDWFMVARCCDLCESLLAPPDALNRKLEIRSCRAGELW